MHRYKSARWDHTRQTALRLAGYVCQECKRHGRTTPDRLHVHHINPRDERPDLFYDQRNLYVLCQEHHNAMENRTTGGLTVKGENLRRRLNRHRGIPPH